MRKIEAKIVADSICNGNRITSFILTYPRFIHAELMTHRMFSRNSASSRAIPFEKMVKMVEEDPFIPIAWQKSHVGMQGTEYWGKEESDKMDLEWLQARNKAIYQARMLHYAGVTKQLCNRLLEPFMWHTVLVTATEWENFFELRCPKYKLFGLGGGPQKSRKDWLKYMQFSSMLHPSQYPKTEEEWWSISESSAEIHIQSLAEAMWDARNESTPKQLQAGEWHIPFGDRFNNDGGKFVKYLMKIWQNKQAPTNGNEEERVKIATARCARLSYMTFDGDIDYEKDIKLHDSLLESHHMSPFEHCCRAVTEEEYNENFKGKEKGWFRNFKGFKSYRQILEE